MAPTALSSPSTWTSMEIKDNRPAQVGTGGTTTQNKGTAGTRPKGRARLRLNRYSVSRRQGTTMGQLDSTGRHANEKNDEPNDTYEQNDEQNTNTDDEPRRTTPQCSVTGREGTGHCARSPIVHALAVDGIRMTVTVDPDTYTILHETLTEDTTLYATLVTDADDKEVCIVTGRIKGTYNKATGRRGQRRARRPKTTRDRATQRFFSARERKGGAGKGHARTWPQAPAMKPERLCNESTGCPAASRATPRLSRVLVGFSGSLPPFR